MMMTGKVFNFLGNLKHFLGKWHYLGKAVIILTLMFTSTILAQTIPNDPDHLPQMIGNRPSNTSVRNPVNVTGKVFVEGILDQSERPVIYVLAYTFGRYVEKRQVSPNGSYMLNGVPRDGLTITFEIEGVEVANYQIIPSISDTISQDATISLAQIQKAKSKNGVVSLNSLYQRSDENQKLLEKALEQVKLKKNSEAINLLKQILKNDEKDFIIWTKLGDLFFAQEKNDDAENAYQKAIEKNPNYVLAMINLGRLYLVKNNGEKAIEILIKAVEAEPNSPDTNYYLGEAYLFVKKGSKAVGYLNEAIRLDPIGKAETHLRLASLYNGANLKDRAAREYQMFLEKVPTYKDREKLEKHIKENLPK